MARDFAKIESPSRSGDRRERSSVTPVLAIVVVASLCFAVGFWLGSKQEKSTKESVSRVDLNSVQSDLDKKNAENLVLQAQIETLQDQVEQWKSRAGAGAHTKVGELKFYKELPEQSVTPAPVPESKPAKARPLERSLEVKAPIQELIKVIASEDDGHAYRIQIASFKTAAEAEVMRSKLSRSGFNGSVQTVNLPDRGKWFRVYAGPYPDKGAAKEAVKAIQERMKIRGLLLRNG